MNLKKTKEILDLNIKEASPKMPPDVLTALIIAYEACERIEIGRNSPGTNWDELLPSETLD